MPPRAARRTFVAGNWKMHTTLPEARQLAAAVVRGLARIPRGERPLVGLFPPAIALAEVARVARETAREAGVDSADLVVGAQNMHPADQGAFTGEISAAMIVSAGATAVILGHSERREQFREADELVGRKVQAALRAGLMPILCVGETATDRDRGGTFEVVRRQLAAGLAPLTDPSELARVVVAYEPVWAIGTGRNATAAEAQAVHAMLRDEIGRAFAARNASPARKEEIPIIYGGSVKPDNTAELMAPPDVDGALVGGASLEAEKFLKICMASVSQPSST